MSFDVIEARQEANETAPKAKVRLFKSVNGTRPSLVIHLGKKLMQTLPDWQNRSAIGLAVGKDANTNKIRLYLHSNSPIGELRKIGVGSWRVDFGYVHQFGMDARPPKHANVYSIDPRTLEIEMPDWGNEIGNGERKSAFKKEISQPKQSLTTAGTFKPPLLVSKLPLTPLKAAPAKGNKLLAAHQTGIEVYSDRLVFRNQSMALNKVQAAALSSMTKFLDSAVSATRCIDLGFRELGEDVPQNAYQMLPAQLSIIVPEIKKVGLKLEYVKGIGFKLSA